MALATQCPFCQTTFRVAQDQLKLRGGLVRCGTCKEVFNGNDHLVAPEIAQQLVVAPPTAAPRSTESAEPHAPLGWPPLPGSPPVQPVQAATVPTPAATESSAPAAPPPWMATANLSAAFASIAAETNDAPWGAQPVQKNETPDAASSPAPQEIAPEPAPAASFPLPGSPTTASASADTAAPIAAPDASINTLTQALSYPVPQTSSVTLTDAGAAETETEAAAIVTPKQRAHQEAGTEEEPEEEETEEAEDDEDAPAFVQKAERRERLGRIVRVAMIVGAVILGIALLLQATYVWRNTIAAWLPSTRPLLAAACAPLHCSVGLPTSIDQLVLDSSELQLVPPNQNIYTLSALLRNRGYGAQAWPYLELTLNDGDEKAITRRVFTPREYLASAKLVDSGLAGEGEQQIKLTFELAQPAASGYRIYLFYP
ncbi:MULTISPECIES: DUF3426 domain-containing protein [unclassified Herbaspirillum]|uniref:DUF3426 domain-containing protein n=1 Tax=unclassified Herbaspirillum TaxID=2624150 RepID=UPI000E2F2628|nr:MULTISPECIES: DUF3426 domain-containing protein [unclassified Herbaspirillum]RFB67218.1 DUF3426 domain-containing protein [Herbaspirillum sp. 3R-3a1]TFI06259.1 DUF3426 domain-containing protein [Herbaspirillum sp. 3R11]TFI14129.1 DUF3426 domain-containing protein [Herbaspirillum sp. 3R-11]TFI27907.1 DUF3426 domain-containing protein [Herbaspirillum sp. 3C11]